MPQIDTPMLLDVLLGLVILLFVPFGVRRGVAKEAMVSAGILLGANLAGRFSQSWGAELSVRFNLQPAAATFAAAVLVLLGSTVLLGYGGGAALGRARPGTLGRLVGGLLAAFNAALLLAYLLTWIDQILQQGAVLDDGVLSTALTRRTDLLLLGGAGVLLVLTVIGWFVNAARSRRQPHEHHVAAGPIPVRQRPVRLAPDADAGKYEPGSNEVPRSGRFGAGLDATSPLAPAVTGPPGPAWTDAGAEVSGSNGHSIGAYRGADSFASAPAGAQNDETVWAAWSASSREDASPRSDSGPWPVAPSVGVTDDERCAVCRAPVGVRDVFCPECGATL